MRGEWGELNKKEKEEIGMKVRRRDEQGQEKARKKCNNREKKKLKTTERRKKWGRGQGEETEREDIDRRNG